MYACALHRTALTIIEFLRHAHRRSGIRDASPVASPLIKEDPFEIACESEPIRRLHKRPMHAADQSRRVPIN